MKKSDIKIGSEILQEIEELSKIDEFLNNDKHGDVVNFVVKQHYGNTYEHDYQRVQIDKKHTSRLVVVVQDKINELIGYED